MALQITDTMLRMAEQKMGEGDVAGTWSLLASAGDLYAAGAYDIIAQIDDPQSIFTKITQVQWDRVSRGKINASPFLEKPIDWKSPIC